jgi:hypothetical protein
VLVSGRLEVPGAARVLKLATVSRTLAATKRVKLRVGVPRKAAQRARRALRKGRHVTARLLVVARDPFGNQSTRSVKVRVKR